MTNYNEFMLTIFDRIMYLGCNMFSFVIYQLFIIAGPIDICKRYMLLNNQSIYGLLVLLLGSIRMAI